MNWYAAPAWYVFLYSMSLFLGGIIIGIATNKPAHFKDSLIIVGIYALAVAIGFSVMLMLLKVF